MLSRQSVSSLCDLVSRSADFHHVASYWHTQVHSQHVRILRFPFLLLPGRASGKICLMLSTLGMSKV